MPKQGKNIALDKEQSGPGKSHLIELKERKELTLTGVVEVINFNEAIVTVHTSLGGLIVKGEGLTMKNLNLESGKMEVEGLINTMDYSYAAKKRGLWKRLFK